jgi:hypothetical protein
MTTQAGKKVRSTKAPRKKANKPSTKATAAAPQPGGDELAPGTKLGTIPAELRVRMKGVTDALNEKRGILANLSFQRTDLRLRLAEVEAAETENFRVVSDLNRDMDACRAEANKSVKFPEGYNCQIDFNSGDVVVVSKGIR